MNIKKIKYISLKAGPPPSILWQDTVRPPASGLLITTSQYMLYQHSNTENFRKKNANIQKVLTGEAVTTSSSVEY